MTWASNQTALASSAHKKPTQRFGTMPVVVLDEGLALDTVASVFVGMIVLGLFICLLVHFAAGKQVSWGELNSRHFIRKFMRTPTVDCRHAVMALAI